MFFAGFGLSSVSETLLRRFWLLGRTLYREEVVSTVMAERSPLDNRSLSHTSREPEGQAWAQIGTKAPTSSAKAPTVLPPPTANNPNPPAAQSPTRAEEDTMSDEGRPLQVVEDADPERLNEASNSSEEKKDGGDAAPNSEKPSEKPEGRDRETGVRDRTNSADPKMVRARVFVGHLNTEKCSRSELEELFSPFGKVASCSLQHGYGFVQYYEEQAAKRAITELHGLHFKGMKLGMPGMYCSMTMLRARLRWLT